MSAPAYRISHLHNRGHVVLLRKFDRRCSVFMPLLLLVVTGCHGGPETDIIERELRWQEDQIYALEDYLMEYQAKVRRLREENASLAKALADGDRDSTPAEPRRTSQPSRDSTLLRGTDRAVEPDPVTVPSADEPIVPPVQTEPEVPLVPEPDVPPLDLDPGTSQREARDEKPVWITAKPQVASEASDGAPAGTWIDESETLHASSQGYDQLALTNRLTAVGNGGFQAGRLSRVHAGTLVCRAQLPWLGNEAATTNAPVESMAMPWLSNEVAFPLVGGNAGSMRWLDEAEVAAVSFRATHVRMEAELVPTAEPDERQLQASLSPLTDDHQSASFSGSVSFMVRDPELEGTEGVLARWDFGAADVRRAWTTSPRGRQLRFPLSLPAELLDTAPVELWVRLIPQGEEVRRKILDHMTLQLAEMSRHTPIEMGNDWAVAKPGEPVLLKKPSSQRTTQWRTAATGPPAGDWTR